MKLKRLFLVMLLLLVVLSACKGGELELKSPAFTDRAQLPAKYTIDGESISPPLEWSNAPKDTKSFALLMYDLDVPEEFGGVFIHWMVCDIPAEVKGLDEGVLPAGARVVPNFYVKFGMAEPGVPMACYGPPWPPTPDHRYRFTLYALGVEKLTLDSDTYEGFTKAVDDNILATAELVGVYGPAKTPLPVQ